MGRLDDLRSKIAKKPPGAYAPLTQPPAQKPIRAVKTLKEHIVAKCGHKVGVAHYASTPCPECVGKARQKNADHNRVPKTERLPDGSRFVVQYDSEHQLWTGSLFVPGADDITGSAPGVFRLLRQLDAAYRKVANEAGQ
jgi:hypothetical protein